MYCYVQSIQMLLVTVTCSGGLLVVGGTAPEVRHCTGTCTITTASARWCHSPVTPKTATSTWLGHDRSRENQRLGLPPVKETSQTV